MVLGGFLSRQKHDDSNLHEIIPVSFNMQSILQSRYYNIGKEKVEKYLVQTSSQVKSSGIILPDVYGISKGLDPNILPEKQVTKPIVTSEMKGTSQIKPWVGQGREGLRQKNKTSMPPVIYRPIVKLTEKPIEQPKVTLKVLIPESSRMHDKIIAIPDYTIPQTRSGDDLDSRKTIQDISRESLWYLDKIYRPPKPPEIPIKEIPRKLSDLDPEINTGFEENSPFQEGMISETYQRPDKSYFQEPPELDGLINTGKLIWKFLLK